MRRATTPTPKRKPATDKPQYAEELAKLGFTVTRYKSVSKQYLYKLEWKGEFLGSGYNYSYLSRFLRIYQIGKESSQLPQNESVGISH